MLGTNLQKTCIESLKIDLRVEQDPDSWLVVMQGGRRSKQLSSSTTASPGAALRLVEGCLEGATGPGS